MQWWSRLVALSLSLFARFSRSPSSLCMHIQYIPYTLVQYISLAGNWCAKAGLELQNITWVASKALLGTLLLRFAATSTADTPQTNQQKSKMNSQ